MVPRSTNMEGHRFVRRLRVGRWRLSREAGYPPVRQRRHGAENGLDTSSRDCNLREHSPHKSARRRRASYSSSEKSPTAAAHIVDPSAIGRMRLRRKRQTSRYCRRHLPLHAESLPPRKPETLRLYAPASPVCEQATGMSEQGIGTALSRVSCVLLSERFSFGRKASFEPSCAIAIVTRPAFRAVQVAAAAACVGILNFQEIEILFPVRTFLIERCGTVADLHPLHPAVGQLTCFFHVPLVLISSDGASPERAIVDGTFESLFFAFFYFCCDEITHRSILRRWPPEEPEHNGLAAHVALYRCHDFRSGFLFICSGLNRVELDVERVDFERVVVIRTCRWSARPSVSLSRRADLTASVRQRRAGRHSFGKARRGRRNVPHEPMHLIIRGSIECNIGVVEVQHETLCSCRRIRPGQSGGDRHLYGLRVFGGDHRPILPAGCCQGHRWTGRTARRACRRRATLRRSRTTASLGLSKCKDNGDQQNRQCCCHT